MRTYAEMAKLLDSKLTDAELLELGEMIDGDARNTLLQEIDTINEARHPEVFGRPQGDDGIARGHRVGVKRDAENPEVVYREHGVYNIGTCAVCGYHGPGPSHKCTAKGRKDDE